ncbi:MAG: hypothetical protein RIS93_10 [Actinomycetota bacterium]
MRRYRQFAYLLILTCLLTSCGEANTDKSLVEAGCSKEQSIQVKAHISSQIDAISGGNWQRAYSLASDSFRSAVTLEEFKQVIGKQYLFLILNDGFGFGKCQLTEQGINQIVNIDFQGKNHILSYEVSVIDDQLGVVSANEITLTPAQQT